VGVVGAVAPLGAVGTTGVGLDHEIGVAVDWDPDDVLVPEDDGVVAVEVDEPAAFGRDGVPMALVVDGAPLVVGATGLVEAERG
jgi:hypothetical protein